MQRMSSASGVNLVGIMDYFDASHVAPLLKKNKSLGDCERFSFLGKQLGVIGVFILELLSMVFFFGDSIVDVDNYFT